MAEGAQRGGQSLGRSGLRGRRFDYGGILLVTHSSSLLWKRYSRLFTTLELFHIFRMTAND
jgi:hypothetical protein